MKKTRIAALDIGTNSIRCIIAEVLREGKFKIIDDEKATVRLGEGLPKTGKISNEASNRAIETIRRFRQLLDGLNVQVVEAIATSAIRTADNGKELVSLLSNELGHEIRIISGVEEAELTAESALANLDMYGKRHVIVDIGGGSVEIITATGNLVEEFYSLDLGAVVMTERFIKSDPATEQELRKLQRHIRTSIKDICNAKKFSIDSLIGSGGTFTALAYMTKQLRKDNYVSIHGYEILRSDVIHLLAMLSRRDINGRQTVPGLNQDRADIIVAGLAVIDEIMGIFSINRILINERGIRAGLLVRAVKRLGISSADSKPSNWRDAVKEFADYCHVDELHATQVASLSLSIFDSLAMPFELKMPERKLLEAAAILHDCGYFISYGSHHKHSYHLIRHADLFGFSPREKELIAQIARYHRKSLPKRKHEAYLNLKEDDRITVSRLGGILRLADGLDRRRSSMIKGVSCRFTGTETLFYLDATEDISVELFGGNAKKDLFEKAFGCMAVLNRTQPF